MLSHTCIGPTTFVFTLPSLILQAGFKDIDIIDSHADLNSYQHLLEGQTADSGTSPCCAIPTSIATNNTCCTNNASATPSGEAGQDEPCMLKKALSWCGISTGSCQTSTNTTAQKGCPLSVPQQLKLLVRQYDINEYAGSYKIFAIKQQ